MARHLSAGDRVFLDAAYAIALSCPADQFHASAMALADDLEANAARLITTSAVLLEIGNALAKRQHRHAAARLLASLLADPTVEIIPLTDHLLGQAIELFSSRRDKEWGLTDCLSFVVMAGRGIEQALTTDMHFQQAGFEVLMPRQAP
jgi:uncharacterized protein